ncbi:MAG: hypothetical protein CM1200mP30_32420 [Pseudomonadota bacterium]|nr:MAG: hypothetical protein CM1200mP30_32420 [Pseudomonadota bacterium]
MKGAGAKIIAVLMDVKLGKDEGVFEKKIRELAIPVYKGLLFTPHMEGKELKVLTLGQLPEVIH